MQQRRHNVAFPAASWPVFAKDASGEFLLARWVDNFVLRVKFFTPRFQRSIAVIMEMEVSPYLLRFPF
jgi:hypothetical protein